MDAADRAEQNRLRFAFGGLIVSWIEELQRKQARLAQSRADPLLTQVEPVVRGMDAISSNSLLDLIGLPRTTGSARRIARTMRTLGFVPLKSRQLAPGGFRDTVTRGWSRPIRKTLIQIQSKQRGSVGG